MRIFLAIVCVGLLIGLSWSWRRPAPDAPTAHAARVADGRPAPALGEVAEPAPRHHSDASAAVRSPRQRQGAAPSAAALPQAATRTAAPERIAQEGDQSSGDAAPRAAGELFLPFIADDPKQVFAPSTVQYHAALSGEAKDPDWAPAVENALRGYIEARFGERYEIPYVDCRQDLCELQVAGRIGADLGRDMHDLRDAIGAMKHEPWWDALEIDQESGTVSSYADGRALLLWFFSRK